MEELVITENIVNEIHRRISPIHVKRIKAEFVKNLHEITLDEFELHLKKLQRKFHENRQYREDFIIYSRWLIKRVLTIISEKKNVEQLTKFEHTILTDLENLLGGKNYLENDQKKLEPTQDKWEHKLRNQIDKFLQILKLPNTIKQNSLELYDEILEYIAQINKKNSFPIFFDSLGGRKDPKYTAAVLIYIILRKEKYKITQKELSDHLDIHRRFITDVLSVLRNFLMKMPEHLYIYDITRSEGLSINNFNILFQGLANYLRKVNIDLSEEDLKEIKILLKNWNLKVNELKVKGFKYLSSTIIYIYIMFYKDQKIYQNEYVNIINDLTPLSLNYSRFSMSFSEVFNSYFKLNINNYKQKMIDYLLEYINEVDATKDILETSINLFEHAVNKRLKKPFTSIYLKTPITKLKIVYIDNEGEVHYIFPQEMAFILLYYSLKQFEVFDFLASRNKFKEYFGELNSVKKAKVKFKTLIETNRVYPLIKDILGRLKREWFTKESFIRELTETLKSNYHSDTDLILKIYLLSIKSRHDLSPQNFIKLLEIYGGKLGSFYRDIVIYRKSFIHPKIFKKISAYIESYIPEAEKDNAREMLTVFIKKRREEWNNYDKKYKFQWNKPNISHIQNNDLSKLIKNYLTTISLGQFPLGLFLDESTDRASRLKLIAKKPHQIKTQDIFNFFHKGNKLIYKFPNNMEATKLLELVKKIYKNPTFVNAKAHRILQDYIINLNYGRVGKINPIATEIPVWKKYFRINEFITGHIDFLFVIDNYLIIADLKPRGKQEILKSIPQLLAYAFMLKERLREINEDKTLSFRIFCLGFSKDEAWVFNPDDVKKEILYFMIKEGVKSPIISSTEKLIAFLTDLGN